MSINSKAEREWKSNSKVEGAQELAGEQWSVVQYYKKTFSKSRMMLQLARSGNSGYGSIITRESFDRNYSEDGLKQYARKTQGAATQNLLEADYERRWAWGTLKLWQVRPRLFEQNELTTLGIWVHEWTWIARCNVTVSNLKCFSGVSIQYVVEKEKVKRQNCTVYGLQVRLITMDCWKVGAKRKEICPEHWGGERNEESVTWSRWNRQMVSRQHQELRPMRGACKWPDSMLAWCVENVKNGVGETSFTTDTMAYLSFIFLIFFIGDA